MLTDVLKAVDELSKDELKQLREYVQQRERQIELRAGTLDMDALQRGLEQMRAELSPEDFFEIERAMNEEFVEPLDENE